MPPDLKFRAGEVAGYAMHMASPQQCEGDGGSDHGSAKSTHGDINEHAFVYSDSFAMVIVKGIASTAKLCAHRAKSLALKTQAPCASVAKCVQGTQHTLHIHENAESSKHVCRGF